MVTGFDETADSRHVGRGNDGVAVTRDHQDVAAERAKRRVARTLVTECLRPDHRKQRLPIASVRHLLDEAIDQVRLTYRFVLPAAAAHERGHAEELHQDRAEHWPAKPFAPMRG